MIQGQLKINSNCNQNNSKHTILNTMSLPLESPHDSFVLKKWLYIVDVLIWFAKWCFKWLAFQFLNFAILIRRHLNKQKQSQKYQWWT